MHINDIVKPLVTEAKNMASSEWLNSSSVPQFLSRLASGSTGPLTFRIGKVDFEGEINITDKYTHNYKAYLGLKTAIEQKNKNILPAIDFRVTLYDDDGKPTTAYELINITKIVKDELFSGKLRVNKGNIAEIVLGCAVTAKYENPLKHIDASHVIDVARRVAQGNGTAKGTAGKDTISFTVIVPAADKKGFNAYIGMDPDGKKPEDYGMSKDLLKAISDHIDNAVKYVNTSPRVAAAVDKAAKDPRKNEIDVVSDGGNAEEQKTTKADLKILIDGSKINLISIKAGDVKQFGQVSGYEFERINDFFLSTVHMPLSDKVKKSFMMVDEKLATKEEKEENKEQVRSANYSNGFKQAYDEIFKHLTRLTGSESGQADLIKRVYRGLLYHATRNDTNVEMIILSPNAKKAFHELTFGAELENALDDYQLTVNRGTTQAMHEIYIYGHPKTANAKKSQGSNKELLVKLRSYAQKRAVRNIVEMGDLLKDIADWEKIEERKATKASTAPTADQHLAKQTKISPKPEISEPITPPPVTPNQIPQSTNLQGTEFTSSTPEKYGMPEEEPAAMMELKTILKYAGLTS